FADTCKLMNSGKSTKKNVIAKTHVTTQGRAVGEGYVVADMAIVTDMRIGHEEAALPNSGHTSALLGADVHGDAVADGAVCTDDQARVPPSVMHRLRRRAERCEWIDHAAGAYHGVAADMNVADQADGFADRHGGADHTIGTDFRVSGDMRSRRNAGRRVDARH